MSTALQAQDQLFFDNYCVSGAFPVCASVRLFTSGNNLTMQVWNLHGSLEVNGAPFGLQHTMTSVGVYHAGAAFGGTTTDFQVQYFATDGSVDDITSSWKDHANDIGTLAGVDVEVSSGSQGNSGVIGCVPPEPGGGEKWITCSDPPDLAYVQFDFELSQAFALNDDVELRWHSQQIQGSPGNDLSLKCDTAGNGDYPPCTVVPEPSTVILVATGLGVVGYLRRRKSRFGDPRG